MPQDHRAQMRIGPLAAPGVPDATAASPARLPFTLVCEQNMTRLYRYALASTRSAADAQDLTADVLHAALQAYPRFRPEKGSPAAWLMGIAHHKLMDYYRRSRQPLPLEDIEQRADTAPCPEDQVFQRLELDQVLAAIGCLPPARAEALALVFFAGLNLSEAGEVMQKSAQAIEKLVVRGIADLKRLLVLDQEHNR
jgi:RNA polymerase sigma-70 factor, ECF subfamily